MSSDKKQDGNPVYLLQSSDMMLPSDEDNINLIDIWRTLVKRKNVFFITLCICIIGGLGYGLFKSNTFSYSTVILIGMQANEKDGRSTPIESVEDALNKMKSAYIPLILAQNQQKNKNDVKRSINVNSPKGSNVVILDTNCKPKDEKICKSLIEDVSQKLIDDDKVIVDITRKNLGFKISAAENDLNRVIDEETFLQSKKKRLNQTAELLGSQLNEKKALLERNLNNRLQVKPNNPANAMSVLLIDNEIQKFQELIDELERKLTIDLNQERDDIDKALKDISRQKKEKENAISQLESLIQGISNTKTIVPVLRSQDPVGLGVGAITLLSVFVGIVVGFLCVFLAEIFEKAKQTA